MSEPVDCPACKGTGKVARSTNRTVITPAQARVYAFVRERIERSGYCPSYQEVSDGVGLHSISTVYKHLHALRGHGLITLSPNGKRAVRLVKQKEEVTS